MKKTSKIIIGLLNLALLVSIITGATFALFSDQAQVSTTITSATVDIELEIKNIELYSLDVLQNGSFQNGGTATPLADGSIELENVSPGDKLVAHYSLINKSNITIVYKVLFSISGELASGLVTAVDGAPAVWTELTPGQQINDLNVSVELPVNAGNEYQNKTANVLILVQAVQGNAGQQIVSAEQLQFNLDNASTDSNSPTLLTLGNDINSASNIVIKEGTHVQIDLNGNDIMPSNDFVNSGKLELIKIEKGASLKFVDSSNTTRYGYYENGNYVISETNKENADVLVGGNISMGNIYSEASNIPAANGWSTTTIRNHGKLTLDGVSIAGLNLAKGDGGAIYSGDSSDSELNANCAVYISNSSICGNTSIGSGIIYTNAYLSISDSLVSNNKSFNGGAFVVRSTNGKVLAERTTFSYNIAEVGAVMQLRAGGSVEANFCPIIGNEAVDMTIEGTQAKNPAGAIIDLMGNTKCYIVVNSCPISGNKVDGRLIEDINLGVTDLISIYTNSLVRDNECLIHSIMIQGNDLGQLLHNYFAEFWRSSCVSKH